MLTLVSMTGLTVVMSACTQPRLKAQSYYYVGFVNKTGRVLENVRAYFGDRLVASPGALVKGGTTTEGPISLPIPTEAKVQWVDDGEHHSVKVLLEGVVPKGFSEGGTVYFVINTNGVVQAKAIKPFDKDAMADLMKGVRPKGEYRLAFINKTGGDLGDVSAYYGAERVAIVRGLPTRAKLGYSDPLTLSIPSELEVRWTEKAADHAVRVRLEGVVPKGYAEGTIFLIIKAADNVEVKPIKWGDNEGSIRLVQ
jgi:cytochrome c-type biogenesis protein CcmE